MAGVSKSLEESNETEEGIPERPATRGAIISRRKSKSIEDKRLEEAYSMLKSATSENNDDDSQAFGNLVALKLRTCDALTKSDLQIKILHLFQNVEKKNYRSGGLGLPCMSSTFSPSLPLLSTPPLTNPQAIYSSSRSPSSSIIDITDEEIGQVHYFMTLEDDAAHQTDNLQV